MNVLRAKVVLTGIRGYTGREKLQIVSKRPLCMVYWPSPRVPEYFARPLTTRQKWQIQDLVKVILRRFLKDCEPFQQTRFTSLLVISFYDAEYRDNNIRMRKAAVDSSFKRNVTIAFPTCNFPGNFRSTMKHVTGGVSNSLCFRNARGTYRILCQKQV